MHVGTQTPRRLYMKEIDAVLQCFSQKLEKLEKELQMVQGTTQGRAKPSPKRKPAANTRSTKKRVTNKNTIQIGANGTTLSRELYEEIDWTSFKKAIRDLCYQIFGQRTLGTHTLTGRVGRGAVMYNRRTKEQLQPEKVQDILSHIMEKFEVNQLQVLEGIRRVCRNSARAMARAEEF